MKTFKLMLLALTVITFGVRGTAAADEELDEMVYVNDNTTAYINEPAVGTRNATFELINESNKPIWISIVNGNSVIAKAQEVGAKSAFSEEDVNNEEIKIVKPTTLAIYTKKPEQGYITVGLLKTSFNENPVVYDKIPTSKTIYVTFTRDNKLVPSKPELPGGRNITRTGLSLDKNNVTEKDLEPSASSKASAVVAEE